MKRQQHSNCEGGYQTKVFPLQCSLNTDLSVFIKFKFLRIVNSLQSFQEEVMILSEKEKNWIQLYLNLLQYLSLHNLFHSVHDKLHDVYLVKSGGARNYVVYDVLQNFLRGARTFGPGYLS